MHSRPKNLNLFTIHFPIPAIVSLLHRISGFFLFLLIPFALWALSLSLTEQGFASLQEWFTTPYVKFSVWIALMPFCYHFVAGIRHLLSDIHIGDSLILGRLTAIGTLVITALLIILTGFWIW